MGALAAIGAFLAKFGALLIKLKYIGLVLSMLVSIAAYSLFFGWTFAVMLCAFDLRSRNGPRDRATPTGRAGNCAAFYPVPGRFCRDEREPA